MTDPLLVRLAELAKKPEQDNLDALRLYRAARMRRRRRRLTTTGVVGAALVATAGLTYVATNHSGTPTPSQSPAAAAPSPSVGHTHDPRYRMNPDPCATLSTGQLLVNNVTLSSSTLNASHSSPLTVSTTIPSATSWRLAKITVRMAPWNSNTAASYDALEGQAIQTWQATADSSGLASVPISLIASDGKVITPGIYAMEVVRQSTYTGPGKSCPTTDSTGTILQVNLS